jgi:hypothetical protein
MVAKQTVLDGAATDKQKLLKQSSKFLVRIT